MESANLSLQKPWDQLPDETDIAYHRFKIYLEMGGDRSLDKTRQKLGKSSGYIRQLHTWSSKYNWVERSGEYDRHLFRKSLEDQEEIINTANGKLLSQVDAAIDTLVEIMNMDNYSQSFQATSNVAQRLKAAESILDRVGLIKQKDAVDPEEPATINNYIQNVYNRIRMINEENPEDD